MVKKTFLSLKGRSSLQTSQMYEFGMEESVMKTYWKGNEMAPPLCVKCINITIMCYLLS